MTRKEALMQYAEKLIQKRESFAKQCQELSVSPDYSAEYKTKQAQTLADQCKTEMGQIAANAVKIIDAALNLHKQETERMLALRNDQAYNLRLQNALSALRITAHTLNDSDIEALREPFLLDAVAMAALKACAIEGGMPSIKAAQVFAYVRSPHADKLESLKTSVTRYAETADPRGATQDDLSLSFALSYGLSSLPDDLITFDSSKAEVGTHEHA